VDRLELIVRRRHPHEWVYRFFLVKIALPIRQQVTDMRLTLGRRVNYFASGVVRKRRARHLAHTHLDALDFRANRLGDACRQGSGLERMDAFKQGMPISQSLPGSRVGTRIRVHVLEQLVGRGDDVLDCGARPGFQDRQSIDQHCRIRDQLGRLFQLGKGRSGNDALLEDGLRFQVHTWG
jgi:hypothetical protein